MVVTFPDNTKTIIDAIRGEIGRNITVYVTVSGIPCPDCDLDPITNTSTNSYCETCDGVYWLNTTSGYVVSGHVRWVGGADRPKYTAGGVIDEGDCVVTVEYTATNLANVQNSDHFVVDDRDLYLEKYYLRGVPTLNRIRCMLKEDSE